MLKPVIEPFSVERIKKFLEEKLAEEPFFFEALFYSFLGSVSILLLVYATLESALEWKKGHQESGFDSKAKLSLHCPSTFQDIVKKGKLESVFYWVKN